MQQPREGTTLWIDNSLNPFTAKALKNVGYNAVVQDDFPEFRELTDGVKDDLHIIPWCESHDAIWVHADNNARTEHAKQLAAASIRTIWVYYPQNFQFTMREQLRALAYWLPKILADFGKDKPEWLHYEIRVSADRVTCRGFVPQPAELTEAEPPQASEPESAQ